MCRTKQDKYIDCTVHLFQGEWAFGWEDKRDCASKEGFLCFVGAGTEFCDQNLITLLVVRWFWYCWVENCAHIHDDNIVVVLLFKFQKNNLLARLLRLANKFLLFYSKLYRLEFHFLFCFVLLRFYLYKYNLAE